MSNDPNELVSIAFVAGISDAEVTARVPRHALATLSPREVLRDAIDRGVASNPVARGAFARLTQGRLDYDRELPGGNETERVLDRPGALADLVQGAQVTRIVVLPEARGAATTARPLVFTADAHEKVRACFTEALPDEVLLLGLAKDPDAPVSDIYVFDGQWVTPVSCLADPEALRRARTELRAAKAGLVAVVCIHTHPYMPARLSAPDYILGEVMGALLHPGTAREESGPDGARWVAHAWNAVTNDRSQWQCLYDARGWCSRCGGEERSEGPVEVPVEVLPRAEGEPLPDLDALRREVRGRLRRAYGPRPAVRPSAELVPRPRDEALADDGAFEADRASLLRNVDALRGRLACVAELWEGAPQEVQGRARRPLLTAAAALKALGDVLREGAVSWD